MSNKRTLPILALAAALVLVAFAAWRMIPRGAPDPPVAERAATPAPEGEDEPQPKALTPLQRQSVLVYYPGSEWNGLIGEEREIFGTASPGDRAKQILADLIEGPAGEYAMRALPPGTRLRQVYVLNQGVAYVDFSEDLKRGIGGGSTEELLTIYAIIDSVALNVSEIKRVGILIDGKPVDTLNGHIDLRRPLPPDRSYIVDESGRGTGALVRNR